MAGNHENQGTIRVKSGFLSKPWARLDGYIFRELTGPFLMAMLVYNGIAFIRTFSEVTEVSSGQFDLPFGLFLVLFLSELPQMLILTTSMSFLLAGLTAIGRMSMDSEIIAPQGLGLSYWRLSRPIIAYGLLLTILNLALANFIGPRLNQLKVARYRDFIENIALPKFQPGVIKALGKGAVFYVDRLEENRMADLLIINQSDDVEEIWLADRAAIHADRNLSLHDAVNINFHRGDEPRTETIHADYIKRPLPGLKNVESESLRVDAGDLATSPHLYRMMREAEDPAQARAHRVELTERTFGALVCFIFSLFVAPIAAKHSRMKRGSGFGISLLMIIAYLVLFRRGKDMALTGDADPLLSMNIANILFLLIGILLQLGKHFWWSRYTTRMTDFLSIWTSRLIQMPKRLLRKGKRAADSTIGASRRARRGGVNQTWQFPRRLDLYVFRYFGSTFLLVEASVLLLMVLVEYTQIGRHVARNDVDTAVVLKYVAYKLPEMIDQTLFITLLISTLVVFAVMSKNREVTAIQAGGGSLQRLCIPLILVGVLGSGFSFYMENYLLPNTNRVAIALRNQIKDKQNTALLANDVWIKTNPGEILNYRYFDPREERLVGVKLYRLGEVIERFETPSLLYEDGWKTERVGDRWRFRRIPGENEGTRLQAAREILPENYTFDLGIELEDLAQEKRRASEFSIFQLRAYLTYLRELGISESHFETELYAKYAQPLLPFLMVLLASPLGFQFGRRGTFYGIGVGLFLGLLFWGLFEFVKSIGAAGAVHPIVAAWAVVTCFGFLAAYRFLELE